MNTSVGIGVDGRGVMMWVTVPRYVFDEVDTREVASDDYEYYDDCWVKVARGNNVNVVFTTYEPPEEN